jgi:hypothetical protein
MAYEDIIRGVDSSIEELCKEFRSRPTLFYTEYDMACLFYTLLLRNLPVSTARDRDGCEHLMVHMEYPTPFRCDASGKQFQVKGDDESTPEGALYQRGHYAIVVLNPDMIKGYSYELVKAQDYELYKKLVLPYLDRARPAILYGLAFMLQRDPFPLLKEKGGERGEVINEFIARVNKGADQLAASKAIPGFMDRTRMLTFAKGGSDEVRTFLLKTLSERPDVLLCFSY